MGYSAQWKLPSGRSNTIVRAMERNRMGSGSRASKDQKTQQKLDARLARMRGGNFGDSEPIGGGASENKIDHGPGYRIYYGIDGKKVIILKGGDKSTQASDIELA